jgi:hypothetical protein
MISCAARNRVQWRLSRKAKPFRDFLCRLPGSLKQLVIKKLVSGEAFDLAVRDAKTGLTFFNIEGEQYDYDAKAHANA